jgi:hypothetical protein
LYGRSIRPAVPQQKHNTMTISFAGTELKIDAVTIRDNAESVWLSPYQSDGAQAEQCEPENAQFWRILKKDKHGRVSAVADVFVY